jgi:prolyl-tRNA synthetase
MLFGKTIKEAPKDAVAISHKLLHRAGFIRESTAGRYYFLPLGLKSLQKIQAIIKEEMDKTGAQEIVAPVLHPIQLWKETNRTNSVGFELMKIKDRSEMEFVLGGTAEEMLVDLVRKFQISYKDLPFNLYQFSTKFRDELRARGGLLRVKEFIMKDAYSFHSTEEDFKKEYEKMKRTYTRIFSRCGLRTTIVESDNGYIGGEYCHEFIVESEAGESKYLIEKDGAYAAHEDIAKFLRDEKNIKDEEKPMREVEAVRGHTMEDGVKLHKLPLWQQIKSLMMVDEKGNMILAVIRGDLDVNEIKLARLTKAYQLRHATEEEIRKIGSEPGFISPVGISKKVKIIGDTSLRTVKNAYTGGNKKHKDLLNVNINKDYKLDLEGDIALAKEGCLSLSNKPLVLKKGIEVGNVFQLGFHYSSRMKDANYKDSDGQDKPYYMGCYGIGLARTLAAVVEKYNDSKGIIWPKEVAPYDVHLIMISDEGLGIEEKAEKIYQELEKAGVEVLFDDRDISPGAKFADADLVGIPVRLVVSKRTLRQGSGQDGDKVEFKERKSEKSELLSLEETLKKLTH